MKKVFTLLFVTIASVSAFAQRSCDVKAVMNKPTNGQWIKAGQSFNLNYTFTNMGPDNLLIGDTVVWALVINNVVVNGTIQGGALIKDIPKDSSIRVNFPSFALTFGNEVSNAQFCATFNAYKRISGAAQVTDPVTTNNLGCVTVNMSASEKVIGNINAVATEVTLSPNPATDYAEVNYNLTNPNTVTVAIYDMNGRQVVNSVSDKQGSGYNSMRLNTSSLNSGLYFYEVKVGNESKRFKLMINN